LGGWWYTPPKSFRSNYFSEPLQFILFCVWGGFWKISWSENNQKIPIPPFNLVFFKMNLFDNRYGLIGFCIDFLYPYAYCISVYIIYPYIYYIYIYIYIPYICIYAIYIYVVCMKINGREGCFVFVFQKRSMATNFRGG
jgi:hypothetical protein